jgi:glycosyltransferase involved in cell wall biosynthesis
VGFRTQVRQWLGPLTFPKAGGCLAEVIQQVRPGLIHAMRIPYEGIIASLALEQLPQPQPLLLISVWGNDFTLHAPANPWMRRLTRQVMQNADALHTDCRRDQRDAYFWGFAAGKPAVVLPGNGGIQLDMFYPAKTEPAEITIINPRGVRAYVRNDTFFQAIPLVLESYPQARFVCPAMEGEAMALRWINKLEIADSVSLLPRQARSQMAALFREAQVVVSPTTHDGTPNTLLEAMACGCYPVAGDIESLREWITPGVNGALAAPNDPHAFAGAIIEALANPELRRATAQRNVRLIAERAEYGWAMQLAEAFYWGLRS